MSYHQTEGTNGTWKSRNRAWHRNYTVADRRRVTDIPRRFRDWTVADLPRTLAGDTVRDWCERWGAYPQTGLSLDSHEDNRGKGLWLWGEPGVGKTTLACIAANHVSDLGWSTKFTTVANLHDLSLWPMRTDSPEERNEFELLFQCYDAGWDGWRLVVLDDMGKEHKTASKWVEDLLDSLIRNRYNDATPTIVTTNLKPEQVGKNYNPSMEDFIREAFWMVRVTGESHRGR